MIGITNKLFRLDPFNFTIKFCHNMHWYARDIAKLFSESKNQENIDEMLKRLDPILEGKNASDAKLLAEKIRKTREATGKVFHSFEYSKAYWTFNLEAFRRSIEAIELPK